VTTADAHGTASLPTGKAESTDKAFATGKDEPIGKSLATDVQATPRKSPAAHERLSFMSKRP
jgi:hypothetical protein